MDFAVIFLLVEGAYVLAAAGIGLAMTRRGRPYKVLLPTLHIVFAFFVLAGMVSEVLVGLPQHQPLAQVTLVLSSLALLTVIGLGINMLVRKTRSMKLANTHKWLVVFFAVTMVLSQTFVLLKI